MRDAGRSKSRKEEGENPRAVVRRPWCAVRGTQNLPANQGNEEDAEAPSTTQWVGVAGETPYRPSPERKKR